MTCTIVSNQKEKDWECKNEHEMIYTAVKIEILTKIQELYCKGYDNFYVNCEYGVPLWAAEAVCALKLYKDIVLHLVIPYEEQSKNWYEEHRERYYRVHENADSVTFVSMQYSAGCYRAAEMKMIDKSDAILAFATPEEKLFAVAYAQQSGKKVIFLPDK